MISVTRRPAREISKYIRRSFSFDFCPGNMPAKTREKASLSARPGAYMLGGGFRP
jgi:hypothetical protein